MALSGGGQELRGVTVKLASGGAGDPTILAGTVNPSLAAGIAADEGSIFLRFAAAAGELYAKTGATDVDWSAVSLGGGLGDAYNSGGAGLGRTIAAISGAVVISSVAENTDNVLEITKNPGGAQFGSGLTVSMGATTTGAGAIFTQGGSGAAVSVSLNGHVNAVALSVTETTSARPNPMISLVAGGTRTGPLIKMENITNASRCIDIDIQGEATALYVESTGGNLSQPLVKLLTGGGDNGGCIDIVNVGDVSAVVITQSGGVSAVDITCSASSSHGVAVDMSAASGAVAGLRLVGQGGSVKFALADAANITTDAKDGNVFEVTLAGNRTLDNPTNLISGFTYLWIIKQSAGGNTLAYGTAFDFPGGTAPTLSVAASAVDLICGVYDGTNLLCSFTADYQ